MYTLIADGGDLTAGRRTASYVYGDWNVSVPDGDEQLKLDEKLGDGFVLKINNGRRLGRMDHTFVKEDVSIDMESKTTDLEAVVEDALGRTSGDVYFQRDIDGVGLNGTVPLRDYNIGDSVRVVRWGKAIPTIVTGIRVSTDKADRCGYTVHVGGELIKNRRLSTKLSDELRRQIARELVDVRNDVGESNRTARRAVTTAGNAVTTAKSADTKATGAVTTANAANTTAKEALNRVADAEGKVQGYLDETGELVEQARESAKRAEDALGEVDPKLYEVRDALASARLLKTAVDERLAGVDSELDDAINKSKSKIIDPAVKQVTDLLQQATTANREAIRLNNEADGFRDQALTDLTDASEKLKQSQASLVEATAKNSDAVDALTKAQQENLKATTELGTATEALSKSDEAQTKALAALDRAQKTERSMLLKAQAMQEEVNSRLVKSDATNYGIFQGILVSTDQVSMMGNRTYLRINRSRGVNVCILDVTRNGSVVTATNKGEREVRLGASCTVVHQGLINDSPDSVAEDSINLKQGESYVLFKQVKSGFLHNILLTTSFAPLYLP